MAPGPAISVRLDDDAAAALRVLQGMGLSRSTAMRQALIGEALRVQASAVLAEEVTRVASDPDDRREKALIEAALDEISAAW